MSSIETRDELYPHSFIFCDDTVRVKSHEAQLVIGIFKLAHSWNIHRSADVVTATCKHCGHTRSMTDRQAQAIGGAIMDGKPMPKLNERVN